MLQAKLIAALILLLAASGAVGYVIWLQKEVTAAKAAASQWESNYHVTLSVANENREALERQRADGELKDRLLARRAAQRSGAERVAQQRGAELETLKRQHQDVRDWVDMSVPDSVRAYLGSANGGAGESGKAISAGESGS